MAAASADVDEPAARRPGPPAPFPPAFTMVVTPLAIGIGALGLAFVGRTLAKRGVLRLGSKAGEFSKGGFAAKMDRREAMQILGLKCAFSLELPACLLIPQQGRPESAREDKRRAPADHVGQPS